MHAADPSSRKFTVKMSTVATGPVLAATAAPVLGTASLALHAKASADVVKLEASGNLTNLPTGFPAHLPGELAWTGSDFSKSSEHILVLDDVHHAEIKAALESYKGMFSPSLRFARSVSLIYRAALDQDGDLVEPDSFPLPTLGTKLRELSRDVHNGRGFCVIRGINPASYSVEDLTLAYLGVQSYIAEQRGRQDKRGNMLGQCSGMLCSTDRLLMVEQFILWPTTAPSRRLSITVTPPKPLWVPPPPAPGALLLVRVRLNPTESLDLPQRRSRRCRWMVDA
jgi:hypothetical protein